MSGGAIAALIAAGAFVVLVLLLAVPLLKVGRTLDEATLAIRKTHDGVGPLLADAQQTVEALNTQLVQVEGIAAERELDDHERRRDDVGRVQRRSAAR